jgi:hypothetical protein
MTLTLTLIKHCTKFTIHSHLNSLIAKKRKNGEAGHMTLDIQILAWKRKDKKKKKTCASFIVCL